ncbi:MAG: linearmycin/streptolysin transport system permease protein [Acidobacteriota bacterium]|jgi:ABC-2 type transport system permease protein|nr:linearmycin/streptolysin transport system permease protein [Acidobacteriota bacterium]
MRVLLAMVGKDLRRRARAPLATILLLAFPLIFAGLIALTFGGRETKVPKVRLLIEDRDGGLVGRLVAAAFQQEEAQKYFEVKSVEPVTGDGASLLEREEATALLRLPAGLSNDVLAGRPARIELVKSPAQSILPDVAEQVTTVLAEGLSSASRLLRGPLDQIGPAPKAGQAMPNDHQVADVAVGVNQVMTRARPYLFPPVITLATATRPAPDAGKQPAGSSTPSVFLLVLPGISVFALFNLADQTMRDLLVEARLKTLRRQLAGPLKAGHVLAGKALSTAAVASLSLLALTTAGALVAPRAISLSGYLLLSFALVVATTGFASAVFGMARGEKQGATLASLVSLIMAFAGGSFIPLDSLPAALRALSPFSLMYWATSGYQKLVTGEGLRAVLPNVAILMGTGLLLLALSALLWQRRLLRGELA